MKIIDKQFTEINIYDFLQKNIEISEKIMKNILLSKNKGMSGIEANEKAIWFINDLRTGNPLNKNWKLLAQLFNEHNKTSDDEETNFEKWVQEKNNNKTMNHINEYKHFKVRRTSYGDSSKPNVKDPNEPFLNKNKWEYFDKKSREKSLEPLNITLEEWENFLDKIHYHGEYPPYEMKELGNIYCFRMDGGDIHDGIYFFPDQKYSMTIVNNKKTKYPYVGDKPDLDSMAQFYIDVRKKWVDDMNKRHDDYIKKERDYLTTMDEPELPFPNESYKLKNLKTFESFEEELEDDGEEPGKSYINLDFDLEEDEREVPEDKPYIRPTRSQR